MVKSMNKGSLGPLVGIFAVQLFDIIIHLATNQVEPIRLVAIGFVLIALAATRFTGSIFSIGALATAGGVYLLLNSIFLLDNGLSNPASGEPRVSLMLIVISTSLLGVLYAKSQIKTSKK